MRTCGARVITMDPWLLGRIADEGFVGNGASSNGESTRLKFIRSTVQDELECLPGRMTEVIVRVLLVGESQRDVGSDLKVSKTTIRNWKLRGVSLLRGRLGRLIPAKAPQCCSK